ncbi:hypothetical protein E2N92_08135 [Methanofollis formosanus]|uniref:Uncharacterized protein n=1 Tax=Methanofollis formosanus TaxID=299308 RepID=A0A8G1A1L9_9EURY|nr:hypothetical protein [Methanofollis formosanus]QYZ79400.1 hypothetical protein E2N92_08135 [Methanofollis formosanus]
MKWRALLWILVLVVVLTPSVAGEAEHFETVPVSVLDVSAEEITLTSMEEPPDTFVIIADVATSNDPLMGSYPALSYMGYAYRVVPVEELVFVSSGIVTDEDIGEEKILVGGEIPTRANILLSLASGATESVPIYNVVDSKKTSPSSAPGYYVQEVPEGTRNHWVDLNWGKGEQNLTLTVWHPSGLLGTFEDGDDGKMNQRIFLRISDPKGVEGGAWYYRVSGPRIPVALNYSFRTYVG